MWKVGGKEKVQQNYCIHDAIIVAELLGIGFKMWGLDGANDCFRLCTSLVWTDTYDLFHWHVNLKHRIFKTLSVQKYCTHFLLHAM